MAGLTVIYVDTLFLLNAIVDYLLLLCSARLAGERLSRLRFALGALLGGLYAVALFLPGFGFLGRPLCRLSAAVLMVLTAFGGCRRLLRQVVIFFLLSCAFGGGVLAIGLLGGRGLSLGGGVLYSSMDLKIVLLSAAGCYAVITLIFRGAGRHTTASRELLPARLSLRERQVELTALVDTGNTLADPLSDARVMVAEWEAVRPLFSGRIPLEENALREPTACVQVLGAVLGPGRVRLLPYRAVGVQAGMLAALRMDSALIGGRKAERVLVALCPGKLAANGNYTALIGAET